MKKSNTTSKKKDAKVTPHELVQRHIADPEHVITDEDMKNLAVGNAAEDDAQINKEARQIDDEVKHLRDSDLPNPYSVLGE